MMNLVWFHDNYGIISSLSCAHWMKTNPINVAKTPRCSNELIFFFWLQQKLNKGNAFKLLAYNKDILTPIMKLIYYFSVFLKAIRDATKSSRRLSWLDKLLFYWLDTWKIHCWKLASLMSCFIKTKQSKKPRVFSSCLFSDKYFGWFF